jgi:photosystem II stability/assembly factor-like uncharacterized protein
LTVGENVKDLQATSFAGSESHSRSWRAVVLGILVMTSAGAIEARAQSEGWRLAEHWQDFTVFDVECASDGPCVAMTEFQGEVSNVVRVTDGSARNWRDVLVVDRSNPLYRLRFLSVHITAANLIVIGCSKGVVAISADTGTSWQMRNAMDSGLVLSIHMADEKRGVALVEMPDRTRRLSATDDLWQTWRDVTLPDTIEFGDGPMARTDGVYFTGAARLVGREIVAACQAYPRTAVLKSPDGGETWTVQWSGSTNLQYLRFADSANGWLYGGVAARARGERRPALMRTTDGGTTWSLALEGARLWDVAYREPDRLLAVGDERSVYWSSDRGATWRADSCPTTGAIIPRCALPDPAGGLLLTSFGSLYVADDYPAGIDATPPLRPDDVKARVDAVRGTITIRHQPVDSDVDAAIFDLSGRLMCRMPLGRGNGGIAEVDWSEARLVSAPYLVTIMAGSRTLYAGMLVLGGD